MKRNLILHSVRCSLAVAAGLAAGSPAAQAQGVTGASATLSGVAGTGNTFDYTLTLYNASSATTPIEGLWYAWVPGAFYLPSAPSSASGNGSGWSASIVSHSIQFQGNSGDAIAPGGSASFTFVSTDTPTTLSGDTGGGIPIGTSYAYPGTISGSVNANDEKFVVSSVPEPSAFGLLATGLLCFWMIRKPMAGPGAVKTTS
jgi:hypothetical protein